MVAVAVRVAVLRVDIICIEWRGKVLCKVSESCSSRVSKTEWVSSVRLRGTYYIYLSFSCETFCKKSKVEKVFGPCSIRCESRLYHSVECRVIAVLFRAFNAHHFFFAGMRTLEYDGHASNSLKDSKQKCRVDGWLKNRTNCPYCGIFLGLFLI